MTSFILRYRVNPCDYNIYIYIFNIEPALIYVCCTLFSFRCVNIYDAAIGLYSVPRGGKTQFKKKK